MKRFKVFIFVLLAVFIFVPQALFANPNPEQALEYLPVQDQGRIKPFDTFARENLQLIWGKQAYESLPATEIVMTWLLAPQLWDAKEFIQINHNGLKKALNLSEEQKHFSPNELLGNSRIGNVIQDLVAKREAKDKLNPFDQAVGRLENQLSTYQMIRSGQLPRLAPPKTTDGPNADQWIPIADLQGELRDKFMTASQIFVRTVLPKKTEDTTNEQYAEMKKSVAAAKIELAQAVQVFIEAARTENPALYANAKDIQVEVHYKHLQPFMWAWILFLVAALIVSVAWYTEKPLLYKVSWAVMLAGFLLTTYGFSLRIYLTGRPPVSNMYETVVWVGWGSVLFSFILEAINRRYYVLLAGAVTGTLCLLTADSAPLVLDRTLQPLEPVLRSTLWLTVHVLVITISYAAYFLAWGLGMIGLALVLKGDSPLSERVKNIVQAAYRSIQIGIVLLAAGIILGGIWADYSWGRFWGWDPKETWALIALLGYLALLHARLSGMVQNLGLLIGAVVSTCSVIMAWYGVNFVLGAGKHTYGFGAGGIEYVSGFIALQLIFVSYVAYVHRERVKRTKIEQS